MLQRFIKFTVLLACVLAAGCSSSPVKTAASTAPAPKPKITAPVNVESEFQLAVKLMQKELWDAATEKLATITAQQPDLSGPWLNLGIAQSKRGKSGEAEAAFKKALDANAENARAYNQLGILYRHQQRYDDAQTMYESALGILPNDADIHWNLALLYDLYLPKPHRALNHYQRYQALTGAEDRLLLAWISSLEKKTQTATLTAKVKP